MAVLWLSPWPRPLQMDEVTQLLIVATVLLLAAGAARLSRRRRSLVPVLPASLGPFPGVVVFGSETCVSCAPVIDALREGGVSFVGYEWETDRQLFDRLNIDEVPRVLAADSDGRVIVDVRGDLTARDLDRLRRLS